MENVIEEENNRSTHPGIYVKEHVFPEGMTVKKAAEMMGIGRPALSNFLNGKANLSQNMATRLAKAFEVDKTDLLKLQHQYTAFLNKKEESRIAVRSYTPSFLNIRAADINNWAEKLDTRAQLPALLRCLINSTGSKIARSDFPAYDKSQKHGWDGQVESKNVTPWVPEGISGWEFGCNNNPSSKANDDYSMRTKNVPKTERQSTTFIFVTPRDWKKKDDWIKSKREKAEWKDVRAYDANNLEQWLELSIPGQVWLAEKIGIPRVGCQTLGDYWNFWSETATPAISPKIFDSAIAAHGEAIKKWYQGASDRPLVVTAGSKEEALAFIVCASLSVEELRPFAEQAVLVSSADTAKRLAAISAEFIPIAHTDNAEKELVRSFKNRHSIVITEKSLKGMEPNIMVDLPNYESFREALTEMGCDDAQIEIYSNQSGKSPTILRRLLATVPALKKSGWATTNARIRLMVPLVLAGTWKSDQEGDKEILRILAEVDYPDIEKNVAELASMDDAPIWIEGKYRGVVSKLDCFHAISDQITMNDLDNFFFIAEHVLSEDDPALDLDKDKRWAANIYEKVRDHSGGIRESICETLIILSVHGEGLFGRRLGAPIESQVTLLIRKLLKDQNERVWQSQQGDLPRYAEAAPNEFLDIVEFELEQEPPAFAPLFESVDGGLFSRCERTGMLWALELLAWEPSRLSRVVAILARLCKYELDDNWSNKPVASVNDILLSWRPHTAASLEQRCDVLEFLCKEYPDVGWEICMRQLKPGTSFTSGTNRPRWRSDASGAGQAITRKDVYDFRKKCQELVLSWPTHTKSTLADLVDCLSDMGDKDRETVTEHIRVWLDSSPPNDDVAVLREHVRTRTLTRRVQRRKDANTNSYADGKKIYSLLEPQNVIHKHQWLFAKQWVEYSPEDLEADDSDFEDRDEKLSKQRVAALQEILEACGIDGLIKLCLKGDAGFNIGWHLGRDIMSVEELNDFSVRCLSTKSTNHSYRIDECLSGLICQYEDEERAKVLQSVIGKIAKKDKGFDKVIRLFLHAPFDKVTWELVQAQDGEIEERYWEKVFPRWRNQSTEDLNVVVDRLMETGRPRAAFAIAHLKPDRIESARLVNLLTEVATNSSEPDGQFRISSYEIERALKSLNKRGDIDCIELARLEYLYVEVLTPTSNYGIPNLSRELAKIPLMFMQMIALCFRRNDNGVDPDEWHLPSEPEYCRNIAGRAYSALEYANVIPGSKNDGTIDVGQLRNWIIKVRDFAKEHGRAEIADQRIGQLLSKSDTGKDGIWPREEVRKVFEEISSKEISNGMEVGLHNSRGAEFHAVDGAKERELAAKYRSFAEDIINKTPFTGRMLLNIAKSYEHDADWHDNDDRVRERLRG